MTAVRLAEASPAQKSRSCKPRMMVEATDKVSEAKCTKDARLMKICFRVLA
jgi:hypothetical protein